MLYDIMAITAFVVVSCIIGYFLVQWCIKSKHPVMMIACYFLAGSSALVAAVDLLAFALRGVAHLLKFV